jgi:hypothetical protein
MSYVLAYSEEARAVVKAMDAETKAMALATLFALTEDPYLKPSAPLDRSKDEPFERLIPLAPLVMAHYKIDERGTLTVTVIDVFDATAKPWEL